MDHSAPWLYLPIKGKILDKNGGLRPPFLSRILVLTKSLADATKFFIKNGGLQPPFFIKNFEQHDASLVI